ncbi:MAG: DALR domain-containing protein, partial [Pseudomonadota bacterium]
PPSSRSSPSAFGSALKAEEAAGVLRKWGALIEGVTPASEPTPAVVDALVDDLNTPGAIAALHSLAADGDAAGLAAGMQLLGIEPLKATTVADDAAELIDRLIADRAAARAAKDFARADILRDGFAAAGVIVKDTKDGATWEPGPGFDPRKLESLV